MRLHHDARRPVPLRRQSTEPVTYVGEGGGRPRERALPSGRALADFLDPNRVTRAIEDLGRSGYRPLAAPSDGGLTSAATATRRQACDGEDGRLTR